MQDVEKFLYSYSDYKRRIEERERQVDELIEKHDSLADRALKSPSLTDIKVSGGELADSVYKAVQKMVDVYVQRIEVLSREIMSLYVEMDGVIRVVDKAGLTEQERRYVELRYFEGLRVSRAAASMGYAEGHVRKVKNNTLLKIGAVLER